MMTFAATEQQVQQAFDELLREFRTQYPQANFRYDGIVKVADYNGANWAPAGLTWVNGDGVKQFSGALKHLQHRIPIMM